MDSFGGLGLGEELVEALAAEGIERPTPFQASAIPVILRGNDLLGRAGPGAGTLLAYAAPLLDRLEGGGRRPTCVVLCTGARQATALARSLGPLAEATGWRAAALTDVWNVPELADFLFVPADRTPALYDGTVAVDAVRAVVFHDGDGVLEGVPEERIETFLGGLSGDVQRVFFGQPFGKRLTDFAVRHSKRATTVPPQPASGDRQTRSVRRGTIELEVVREGRLEAALSTVSRVLDDPVRHVMLFTASSDQAADAGDFLALHGFHTGRPGDPTVPIWLAVEDEDPPPQPQDPGTVATVSFTVPAAESTMITRHKGAGPRVILSEIRELGHLKQVASAAGFRLERRAPERPVRVSKGIDDVSNRIGEVVTSPEVTPYYLLVESLLSRFTPAEVAAAALCMLDRARPREQADAKRGAPSTWVRLFVSVGERDGIGPRELLGAVAGESGIPGGRVGRIDVRESHSLVEVREQDAKRVIDALNGTTIGGRSARVDYDRGKDRKGGERRGGTRGRKG